MVAATLSDRNAPIRSNAADTATATRGRNAPVAIELAIGVSRVVKPVCEVEAQRGHHNQRQQDRVPDCWHSRSVIDGAGRCQGRKTCLQRRFLARAAECHLGGWR